MTKIHLPSRTIYRIIQGLFLLFPLFLFLYILNNRYLLFSDVTFTFTPGQPATNLQLENPASLVRSAGSPRWIMTGDALPIAAALGRFPEAVTVSYELEGLTQSYLTLQADTVALVNNLVPIARATALDSLDWPYMTVEPLTLWQRPGRLHTTLTKNGKEEVITQQAIRQFDTFEEFKKQVTDYSRVAVAGVHPLSFFHQPNYTASTAVRSSSHVFRGSHRLLTYIDGETLNLSFDKIDLNRRKDPDVLTVRIGRVDEAGVSGQRWLVTKKIRDDGIAGPTEKTGRSQALAISLPTTLSATAPGVYIIDIVTTEDVTFTNLKSTQKYLAFEGRVFLAEGPAYDSDSSFTPVNLVTNGTKLGVAAAHREGQQTIAFGKQKLNIKDIKIEHTLTDLKNISNLTIAKGDIIVTSDGHIAIDSFQVLPTTGATPLHLSQSANFEPYDYVVATYRPGGSSPKLITQQTYPLKSLVVDGQKRVHFNLSAPGRTAAGAVVGVKKVVVTFHRGPFPWAQIRAKLSSWLK